MAEIEVLLPKMKNLASEQAQISNSLKALGSQIDNVAKIVNSSMIGVYATSRIISSLKTGKNRLDNNILRINKLSSSLEKAINEYIKSENKICSGKLEKAKEKNKNGLKGSDWIQSGLNIASKESITGAVAKTIYDVKTGKHWDKILNDGLTVGKNVAKRIPKIKNSPKWSGISKGLTVIGWGLTGVGKLRTNSQKYKGDNAGIWTHTLVETGVEIGLKEGTKWLAGLAIGAAIGTTAPAWAVAVGGAVIYEGLDLASKYITGESLSTNIANTAIKFGECIGEGAKNVGNAINKIGNSCAKWFGFAN